VALPHASGIQVRRHRLADPVVVGLDPIAASGDANHPAGAQRCQVRDAVAWRLAHQERVIDRASGDGDQLQKLPRRRGQLRHPGHQDLLEGGALASAVPGELGDEHRVALRLARDLHRAIRIHPGEQRPREIARIVRTQRTEGQLPRVGSGAAGPLHRPHAVATRAVLGTIAEQQEDGRRVGTADQLGQEGGAVHVAPLQVVDPDHHRTAIGDPRQELLVSERFPEAEERPPSLDQVAVGEQCPLHLLAIHPRAVPRPCVRQLPSSSGAPDGEVRGRDARIGQREPELPRSVRLLDLGAGARGRARPSQRRGLRAGSAPGLGKCRRTRTRAWHGV